MFELPDPTNLHDDEDREPVFSIVALMAGLLLIVSTILAVGFVAVHFISFSAWLQSIGLAAFLPAWRDHHTEARQEWVAEQGQGPTAVETWMLRVCWVGLVAVLVWGQWFGGAA